MMSQRARNRVETWNTIHRAAFEIALDHGPHGATVDEIATSAGVSRRTFFNYFPTKEDAILATRSPQVTDQILQRFRSAQQDELTRVVKLFAAVVRTSMSRDTATRRRRILEAHPSLRGRVFQLLGQVESLVAEVLEDPPEDDDASVSESRTSSGPNPAENDVDEATRILLMLAGAITKHAFSHYQQASGDDLRPFLDDAIAAFRKVVDTTR